MTWETNFEILIIEKRWSSGGGPMKRITARWFSENTEYTEITREEKVLRDRIVAIIDLYTREMEQYGYFGSNPGVGTDDYEDVADHILLEIMQKKD